MWNIFESYWLLTILAVIAWIVAMVVRREKPEWGFKPLLVPLLLGVLAFGLDYFVTTDFEAVSDIFPACRRAAIAENPDGIIAYISPNYKDKFHPDKARISDQIRRIITGSSVQKIRTQSNTISLEGTKATSEFSGAIHLNQDSRYADYGTFHLVEIKFEYEKISDTWYIRRMDLKSVDGHSMNWPAIP